MKEYLIKIIKSNVRLYKLVILFYDCVSSYKKKNLLFRSLLNILQFKRMKSFKNNSVLGYVKENALEIKCLEDRQYRELYIPVNIPIRNEAQVLKCVTPPIYYAILENIMIIGGSNIIIKENQCLNDKLLLSYCDNFIFNTGPVHEYTYDKSKVEIDVFPKDITEGISLIGEAANNYYHWVFDLMNKIVYINQFEELSDIPLLIDETVSRHSTCINLLNVMDKRHHPIIYLKSNRGYRIKKLHYFSPCTWSNVYEKDNTTNEASYAKSAYAINFFRENLDRLKGDKQSCVGKKIFITRPSDKFKRLVNEDELAEIAVKYGFKLYDPAQFTIEQQAADFFNVDYIIAASGAALVNLIWCQPGTKLLCVSLAEWNDYNYSTLAHLLGIECVYIDGNTIEGVKHTVDKEIFEKWLKEQMDRESAFKIS